jgi:parvulin-like peptidyl-prolyl isomerase
MGLLQKQHDFADLARKYSEGPHAQEGGLWDFVRQGVRPEPLDKLIFSLPVGEAGGPVQTNIGYTIIMVEARRKARTIPFEEVQAQLEKQLLQEEWQRRYKQLIKRLEKEHHVLRLD